MGNRPASAAGRAISATWPTSQSVGRGIWQYQARSARHTRQATCSVTRIR